MQLKLMAQDPKSLTLRMEQLRQKTSHFITHSKADNTIRAYRSDWSQFELWCAQFTLAPMPAHPETIALYITHLADTEHRASTIQRYLSSISQAHITKGFDSPTKTHLVQSTWAGIRRELGMAPHGKAAAITEDIRRMVATLPDSPIGVRDRALLLIGFAGAFRRSELVNIQRNEIEFTRDGLVITIRQSKTDQEQEGQKVGIPYGSNPSTCPIRNLQDWLELAHIESGSIFRGLYKGGIVRVEKMCDRTVARIVQKCALAAGLDPTLYAGHSLRAGLATSAAMANVSERDIMRQTRHKSVLMVRRYIRDASLFSRNAAASVGL